MEPTAPDLSFREEDFSLFHEDRRANNRFNKDRLALKEKLTRLGGRLTKAVPEAWKMELGTEHPAVWNQRQVDRLEVFFMRPEEDRRTLSRALNREIPLSVLLHAPSPLYAHASLGFFLHEQGIEVGFRLPFLAVGDRSQLRRIVSEPGWSEALAAFSPILSGFGFAVHSTGPGAPLDPTNPAHWCEGLDDLERVGQAGDHRSYLGLVLHIPVADSLAADCAEALLMPALEVLGPFAVAHTWRPETDLLGVEGMISAQASASQVERERSELLRLELIQPRPVVARPIMTAQRPTPAQATPAQARTQAPRSSTPAQARTQAPRSSTPAQARPAEPRREPAPPRNDRPPRPREKKPVTSVEPGARIILASGPFEGKEAVVIAELPDDQLRVRVGMLQMTVERKDCLAGRG